MSNGAEANHQTDAQQSSLVTSLSRHLDTPPSALAANMAWFAWYPYQPNISSNAVDPTTPASPTDIVHCRVCQRRVGLWAFRRGEVRSGKKYDGEFDLVKEHLSWCPFRHDSWWTSESLLRGESEAKRGAIVGRGWVKVSDRMEKKPWRRV